MNKSLFKKSIMASAISVGLMGATSAYAGQEVLFSPTGSAGDAADVASFTLRQNAILALNAFDNSTAATSISTATLLGQGLLQTYNQTNNVSVSNGNFTYEFSLNATASKNPSGVNGINGNGASVAFDSNADFGTANYFNIYYTPIAGLSNAQQIAGEGFGAGGFNGASSANSKLILSGKVDLTAFTFAINKNATVSIQDTTPSGTPPGIANQTSPGSLTTVQNASGTNLPVSTVQGGGELDLVIDVCQASEISTGALATQTDACKGLSVTSFVDTNFFRSQITTLGIVIGIGKDDLSFTENTRDPQNNTVPAKIVNLFPHFGDPAGGALANDFTCGHGNGNPAGAPCDMIYGAQASTINFNDTRLPEPATLALLGIGLLGIGARAAYRKRS